MWRLIKSMMNYSFELNPLGVSSHFSEWQKSIQLPQIDSISKSASVSNSIPFFYSCRKLYSYRVGFFRKPFSKYYVHVTRWQLFFKLHVQNLRNEIWRFPHRLRLANMQAAFKFRRRLIRVGFAPLTLAASYR